MDELAGGLRFTISIHALLAESDCHGSSPPCLCSIISIHALLAESDAWPAASYATGQIFLSTLSLRRATIPCNIILTYILLFLSTLSLRRATAGPGQRSGYQRNFYPRSPCGERRIKVTIREPAQQFLSTLSLRRATRRAGRGGKQLQRFLSTLSLRRATCARCIWRMCGNISIHALLAESD